MIAQYKTDFITKEVTVFNKKFTYPIFIVTEFTIPEESIELFERWLKKQGIKLKPAKSFQLLTHVSYLSTRDEDTYLVGISTRIKIPATFMGKEFGFSSKHGYSWEDAAHVHTKIVEEILAFT